MSETSKDPAHYDAGNGVEPIEYRDLEQFYKIVVATLGFRSSAASPPRRSQRIS